MYDDDLELIDEYLDGALTGPALEAFERRITAEPGFAWAVEEQKILRSVVIEYGWARRTAARIQAELEKEGFFDRSRRPPFGAPRRRTGLRRRFWIFALIALAVLLSGIFLLPKLLPEDQPAEPSAPGEPVVFSIPARYRNEKLSDLHFYLNNYPGINAHHFVVGSAPNHYRSALATLEKHFADPIASPQEALHYYYAGLICLYALEESDPARARGYLVKALPHPQGDYDRERFNEAYLVALLLSEDYATARVVYAQGAEDYFLGYRGMREVVRELLR